MQFRELEKHFKGHQLITIQDIRNVFGTVSRVQLSRWEDKKWLIRIRQGQYILGSTIGQLDLELLANEIKNSYISLEYALSYYNFIPEITQSITCVTTERSEDIETPVGLFIYHHVKPALFSGYQLIGSKRTDRKIKMAFPTKALFDYIYLKGSADFVSFDQLRLNFNEVRGLFDKEMYIKWKEQVLNPALKNRLANFLKFMDKNA